MAHLADTTEKVDASRSTLTQHGVTYYMIAHAAPNRAQASKLMAPIIQQAQNPKGTQFVPTTDVGIRVELAAFDSRTSSQRS